MDNSSTARIVTVRDPNLSLWQSAVAEVVSKEVIKEETVTQMMVFGHPMVQGANVHVVSASKAMPVPLAEVELNPHVALSQLHYELANAQIAGNSELVEELQAAVRSYSTLDVFGWASCVASYIDYYVGRSTAAPVYRSAVQSNGSYNYDLGVIEWSIPNDGKVAIIGDWGTGMDDATALLNCICQVEGLSAIIHLGDIYYSGTPLECQRTINAVCDKIFAGLGKRIPFFAIPGNHDYYSGGAGFYASIDKLNKNNGGLESALQTASFFRLRTEDEKWQFLGMDTGYNDHNPLSGNSSPDLPPGEAQWHTHHLQNFKGQTIMLSHHQLFSAKSSIGNSWINNSLLHHFEFYFFNGIAAWLWGHEHNLVIYQDNISFLSKGRLIGCSAYEEADSDNPYAVNTPNAPFKDPSKYRLDLNPDGFYNHGYAIIDFGARNANDQPLVNYYQYKEWGGSIPSTQWPAAGTLVYSERYGNMYYHGVDQPIGPGDLVTLENPNGMMISHFLTNADDNSYGNIVFPSLQNNSPVSFRLLGNYDYLTDGASVNIVSSEYLIPTSNYLRNYDIPLRYGDPVNNSNTISFQISKVDKTDGQYIHDQDQVYIYAGNPNSTVQYYRNARQNMLLNWTAVNPTPWKISRVADPRTDRIPVRMGDRVKLVASNGYVVSHAYKSILNGTAKYYYPYLDPSAAVALIVDGPPGTGTPLMVTDTFHLLTTETNLGDQISLGAWRDSAWCYYYTGGRGEQVWKAVPPARPANGVIYYGDPVRIFNPSKSSYLVPDQFDSLQGGKDNMLQVSAQAQACFWTFMPI